MDASTDVPEPPTVTVGEPNLCFNGSTSDTNLVFQGGAARADAGSGIVLASAPMSPLGSVFHRTPVPTNRDLDMFFAVDIGPGSASTNGLSFVIQRDPRGAEAPPFALGGDLGDSHIGPRVGIAFNAQTNNVSVGSTANPSATTAAAPESLLNARTNVWVTYRAATGRFSVYVSRSATRPAMPTVENTIDLRSLFANHTTAFVGFTAVSQGPRITLTHFTASSQSITTTSSNCPAPPPCPTPPAPAGGCAVGSASDGSASDCALLALAGLAVVLAARRRLR